MDESQYRVFSLTLLAATSCIVAVAVGLRIFVRNAIEEIVHRSTRRQLLNDFTAFRAGKPLQQIHSTPAATSKALLQAITRV